MTMTDKLKGMVEELRSDLTEVKDQVRELLPLKKERDQIAIERTDQEHPIAALQRETNRMFDDFLRGWGIPGSLARDPFGSISGLQWPTIDVDESDERFRITADLAGMDKDDVDLSVADGVLTIRGEKTSDTEDEGRHHYRRECFYGSFSRSIPVPADIDLDAIEASMKNGVLKVELPKLPGSAIRGRRIAIGSGTPK